MHGAGLTDKQGQRGVASGQLSPTQLLPLLVGEILAERVDELLHVIVLAIGHGTKHTPVGAVAQVVWAVQVVQVRAGGAACARLTCSARRTDHELRHRRV